MAGPVRYNSAADLAALFGVQPGTVETWRARYGDFPEPDAYVGRYAGWLPEREAELREWEASRPGRGAGGGRPRTVKDDLQPAAIPIAAEEPEPGRPAHSPNCKCGVCRPTDRG